MKVLHIATTDRIGGAAISAYRQHLGLLEAGVESEMLVRVKVTNNPLVQTWNPSRELRHRLPRVLRRHYLKKVAPKPVAWRPFSDVRGEFGWFEADVLPPHDVVNLQFTSDFLDQPALIQRLDPKTPVVITMHDMNPLTGGCHYTMGCGEYLEKCGRCPQLQSTSNDDLSRAIWNRKLRMYELLASRKVHYVANSRWLARLAGESSLLRSRPITAINCGVDTRIFRPLDRTFARQVLGIPLDSRVVMFAADSVENERKGGRYLYDALAGIKMPLYLVTAGAGYPPSGLKFKSLHLGNLDCENLLALAYNAADVFVIPSTQEAFGQTALEASACGVAVAGFNAGGIAEIIADGETGVLSPVKNTEALRNSIEHLLLNDDMRKAMGAKGRERVEQKFTLSMFANQYLKVYNDLLGGEFYDC
jgi:glycosyltransferase involved in cell wall biosynthesis